jgi:hypothetical protein
LKIIRHHQLYFLFSLILTFLLLITFLFDSLRISPGVYSLVPRPPTLYYETLSILSLANGGVLEVVAQPLAWFVVFGMFLSIFMYRFLLRKSANAIEGAVLIVFGTISLVALIMIPNHVKDPNFTSINVNILPLHVFQIVLSALTILFALIGTIMAYLYGSPLLRTHRFHEVHEIKNTLHHWKI